MSTPAECRENASDCAELATRTENSVHPKLLLGLAEKWQQLAGAKQQERHLIREDWRDSRTHCREGDHMKLNDEARLLLRLGHLRTLRWYAQDAQIVLALNDFIAETEAEIVTLKPSPRRAATLH
jgi:hypothetical protein